MVIYLMCNILMHIVDKKIIYPRVWRNFGAEEFYHHAVNL